VALNLTFLSQAWGYNTVQFANSPFWSLSYECMFYVAYGLMFYLRGAKRIVTLLVWAVIGGAPILFLFPLWLLGCVLYDAYESVRRTPAAAIIRKLALLYAILAVALAAIGRKELLLAPFRLDAAMASLPNPLGLAHLVSSRATMLAVAHGTVAALAMFLLLLLSDFVPLTSNHPFARRFRRLADGTFAIYLMHYPLMMLARATGALRPNAPLRDGVTVAAIVLVLIAAAAPLDRLKSLLRRTLGGGRKHAPDGAGWLAPDTAESVTVQLSARSPPSAAGSRRRKPLRSTVE
jgi:peptidoglycan/LPS O-acetylase OafA/YrhL